ncbi:MAG TPA: hypothetical protein VF657_10585 [Actinoplanes sp.]|jgi:hypothetical protein
MTTRMSGRGWAYTGATLGGLVSIAANIAHSYVPPTNVSADWAPKPGAVVGAIVWPIFLFVAVEILARTAWPHGLTWQLLRWAGLVPVAVVAALVSYRHLSGLLAFYGEEPLVCVLGPLAVDGLMVMATGAMLATHQPPARTTSTTPTTPVSVPAVPNALTRTPAPTITPSRMDTPASPSMSDDTEAPSAPAPAPEPVAAAAVPAIPTPAVVAARITPATPTSTPTRPATPVRTGTDRPSPRPRKADAPSDTRLTAPATDIPVTTPDAAQLASPMMPPDLLARAHTVARQYRTEHGTPITPGQLAVRLKVTSEQATQALAVLGLGPDNPTTPVPAVNGNRPTAAR